MLKLRRDEDLSSETLGADSFGDIFGQDLDHDLAIEMNLGRKEDAAHAAATKLALYAVGSRKRECEAFVKVSHSVKMYPSG